MKRLSYIDRVKGLFIISVVLGHAAWSIGLREPLKKHFFALNKFIRKLINLKVKATWISKL